MRRDVSIVTTGAPGAFKMRRPVLALMLLIAQNSANDKSAGRDHLRNVRAVLSAWPSLVSRVTEGTQNRKRVAPVTLFESVSSATRGAITRHSAR